MTSQSEAHRIARQIIERHGVDRYPSLPFQVLKLVAEVGELAEAVLTGSWEASRRELGQVGVTLHLVADKLGQLEHEHGPVDVLDAMRDAVELDPRKHRDSTLRGAVGERPVTLDPTEPLPGWWLKWIDRTRADAVPRTPEEQEAFRREREGNWPVDEQPLPAEPPAHVVQAGKDAYLRSRLGHEPPGGEMVPDRPEPTIPLHYWRRVGDRLVLCNCSLGDDHQCEPVPPGGEVEPVGSPDTPSGISSSYAGPTDLRERLAEIEKGAALGAAKYAEVIKRVRGEALDLPYGSMVGEMYGRPPHVATSADGKVQVACYCWVGQSHATSAIPRRGLSPTQVIQDELLCLSPGPRTENGVPQCRQHAGHAGPCYGFQGSGFERISWGPSS